MTNIFLRTVVFSLQKVIQVVMAITGLYIALFILVNEIAGFQNLFL
jgi:hypothetical protein